MASNNMISATQSSSLANAGQRVIHGADGNSTHNSSAFIQMRQKPPATTFSAKALSFYSNENFKNRRDQGAGINNASNLTGNAILIQSTDKVNYQTHDNNMTTNREVPSHEEDQQSKINV